jgi:hypothetical protein
VLFAVLNWCGVRAILMLAPIPGGGLHILTLAVRMALCVWVGWRVRAQVASSLFVASLSGVMIPVADHLVLRSILFVLLQRFVQPDFEAGYGVLGLAISLLFVGGPIAVALAFVGAVAQGKWRQAAVMVAS